MSPFPVIEVHNVLIDDPFRLFTAFEFHAPDQLRLQGLAEGLDSRIVSPLRSVSCANVTVAFPGRDETMAYCLSVIWYSVATYWLPRSE